MDIGHNKSMNMCLCASVKKICASAFINGKTNFYRSRSWIQLIMV